MQDFKLIKVSDEPVSSLKTYLKKMRHSTFDVPSLDAITKIVYEVRAKRYSKT